MVLICTVCCLISFRCSIILKILHVIKLLKIRPVMKIFTEIFFLLVLLLFAKQVILSQNDPLAKSYIIREGGGDELVGYAGQTIELSKYLKSGIVSQSDTLITMLNYQMDNDLWESTSPFILGDFDGNELSEIAAVVTSQDGKSINLVLLQADPDLLGIDTLATWSKIIQISKTDPIPFQSEWYIKAPGPAVDAGDFDGDGKCEILLGYWAYTGTGDETALNITIYEVDSALNLTVKDSFMDKILTLPPPLFETEEANIDVFKLETGDLDGDSTDEIFIATRESGDTSDWYIYATVYKYDQDSGKMLLKMHEKVYTPMDTNWQLRDMILMIGNLLPGETDQAIIEFSATNENLDDTAFVMMLGFNEELTQIISSPLFNAYNYGFLNTIGDVNGDGTDEVLFLIDSLLYIYQFDELLQPELYATIKAEFSSQSANLGNFTGDSIGNEIPNVILFGYKKQGDYWYPIISIYKLNIGPDGSFQSADLIINSFLKNPLNNLQMADFDTEIRLGAPKRSSITKIVQPLVILNAPPIHFDIFNDTSYDISKSYNENEGQFISSYVKQSSQMAEVQTEINTDWGISATLSTSHSFFGVSVSSYLTTNYGEKFSKVEGSSQKVTVGISVDAKEDDRIYATVLDYDVWEYPVYGGNKFKGNVLVVEPKVVENRWFPSKSWSGYSYIPIHEVGNILSYREYPVLSNNPELTEKIKGDYNNSFVLDANSSYDWSLSFEDFQQSGATREKEFSMEWGASVGGWGVNLEINGHYSKEEINTQRTEISDGLDLQVHLDAIDMGIGEVGYIVTPYSYWAKNGALVIDYAVKPELAQQGGTPTWWQVHYGEKADPTFILPWKYDPEKGFTLEDEVKRLQTKDITFFPSEPVGGDKVTITARVHNFSLMQTPDQVGVRFYIGDPDNGGIPIIGTEGQEEVFTLPIPSRGTATVQMDWIVPENIGSFPRIYGVIDKDNVLDEIHETNNKGWTILGKTVTGTEEELPGISVNGYSMEQNYPNPFSSSTNIRFTLPKGGKVRIDIYNIQGQNVCTLLDDIMSSGEHEVIFNAGHLPGGLYFYKVTAGEFHTVKKMILLR